MTERYIELQSRLYELGPDPDIPGSQNPSNANTSHLARIVRRLEHLKSDILFDRYDADQKWTEKRNQLAKAAAQRRNLRLEDRDRSGTASPGKYGNDDAIAISGNDTNNGSEEDLGVEAFGDFFSGLPDATSTGDRGTHDSNTTDPSKPPPTVRDFGKWNGMSPRRILEDACKARLGALDVLQIHLR